MTMVWHKITFYYGDGSGDLTSQVIAFMNKHKLKPGELLVVQEIKTGVQQFTTSLEATYCNDVELKK